MELQYASSRRLYEVTSEGQVKHAGGSVHNSVLSCGTVCSYMVCVVGIMYLPDLICKL